MEFKNEKKKTVLLMYSYCCGRPTKKKDPNQIWDDDEVDEARLLNKVDASDKRIR
jgi:hypothetical protein